MDVANTLAFYDTVTIVPVKSFIVEAPVLRNFSLTICYKLALADKAIWD
jgi:hypothetical protein